MREWIDRALLGDQPAGKTVPVGVEVRRQDFNKLARGRSVLNTPLQIGPKHYDHGLGTHAISELVIHLPEPGQLFEAEVGVDNNSDTKGRLGSVVFAVEVGGKEVYRSDVRRGGNAPVPVRVELQGAQEFTLRVGDAGDGVGWDQADWAEAAVTTATGQRLWLDELPVASGADELLATGIPFSFDYNGKTLTQLLPTWKRTQTKQPAAGGQQRHQITYADPDTGLEVVCDVTIFADYPAVEWVLRLRNTGSVDTPILENIRSLDLRLTAPPGDIVLHHAHGSTCAATDFLPIDDGVAPNATINLAPNGGRSSDGQLPFFNLHWTGGGIVGAIGWSGQWALSLKRDGATGLTVQAGQQVTHLKLHPGESIRTPRILLVRWAGADPLLGHNLLRRLLLAHYVPRVNGEIAVPPVTQLTWFSFNTGNDVTEANQLAAMAPMVATGVEGYWLDAGWFEGGWPAGAGSWVPKHAAFPNGLKPLGDAAHKQGLKFVVWFEPERVTGISRIAKEHPEWVLRAGAGDGLFNLGDPAARQWLTDFLTKCIQDWGIDIFRNDFNIAPLRFWQAADPPDRKGMAEIRYTEGLYQMWDDLRTRNPGLLIDNCASGGRRIDLEMISRSFPLWRSDTQCCGKAMPVQDQTQTAGLSLYVPLHAAGVWDCDPYPFRSVGTTGTSFCMDTRAKDYPIAKARRAVDEMKSLRPLFLGDYYPLTSINLDEHHWCGWQFDRPDQGQGFAVFFRRAQSPYGSMVANLRGLDPQAQYEVTFVDSHQTRVLSGAELARLPIEIGSPATSLLLTYRKLGN